MRVKSYLFIVTILIPDSKFRKEQQLFSLLLIFSESVESIISSIIICWGNSFRTRDLKRLNDLIKKAGSGLGTILEPLDLTVQRRIHRKTANIFAQPWPSSPWDHWPLQEVVPANSHQYRQQLLEEPWMIWITIAFNFPLGLVKYFLNWNNVIHCCIHCLYLLVLTNPVVFLI